MKTYNKHTIDTITTILTKIDNNVTIPIASRITEIKYSIRITNNIQLNIVPNIDVYSGVNIITGFIVNVMSLNSGKKIESDIIISLDKPINIVEPDASYYSSPEKITIENNEITDYDMSRANIEYVITKINELINYYKN